MNAPFAGTLRTRVRFDRPVRSRDAGVADRWVPSFEAWARVRAQTGNDEGIVSGGELATAGYDLQLRYRGRCDKEITADMSVYLLPEGPRLDILSEPVDPDGTRERTLIRCEYRGGAA